MLIPGLFIPSLLLSFALSVALVPLVRKVVIKLGRVVTPREDRWHRQSMPTLGGVAMYLSFMISVLVMTAVGGEWTELRWSLLLGSTLMFALGFIDDLVRLTPPTKLVIQFLAAAIVIYYGRVIDFFPWPIANIILTFFFLVGITNAINLLDNMDGLAGGMAFIAAGLLSYFFLQARNEPLLVLCMSLAGSILGFLIFNFPPAKIFMGDSGSLFLGFTLAAITVAHRPRASNILTVLGVPTMLFLLPIFDTTLVTITRLLRGQSPAQGGTDHTSHRLIAFGLTERQAVLSMYAIGVVSGVTGLVLEVIDYHLSLLLIPLLLIIFSLVTAYLGRLKVVSSFAPVPGNITRLMVELTYKRRLLEIVLDFFLIGLAYYLAFLTSSGMDLDNQTTTLFARTAPIALAGSYLAFYIFGVYRGVWRYIGVDDLLRFGRAVLGSVVLTAGALYFYYSQSSNWPVILFLFAVFLFLGLAASRSSFRLLDRLYRRQDALKQCSVLIYGAEDAGEMALRWILSNPDLGYHPVGFLDDDPYKWGRRIHGVNILGGKDQLEAILEGRPAEGVIITSPDLVSNGSAEPFIALCRKKGIWVRLLKMDFELVE
jgi:UDP-GlcNAc:undecaprenyl-phosphate GlcNAc-1-phosphate transferase